MIAYLWALTAFNALFLVCMRALHWTEVKAFHDHVKYTRNAGELGLGFLSWLADFIQDTVKYIIVAIVILAISMIVYVWALRRPALWKAYSILIGGIALSWVGGNLTPGLLTGPDSEAPHAIASFLAGDKHLIVANTILVVGHLYIFTSIMQFLAAVGNEDFWSDVREKKARNEAEVALRASQTAADEVFAAFQGKAERDAEFRRFFDGLSNNEKGAFMCSCWQVAGGRTGSAFDKEVITPAWKKWPNLMA